MMAHARPVDRSRFGGVRGSPLGPTAHNELRPYTNREHHAGQPEWKAERPPVIGIARRGGL